MEKQPLTEEEAQEIIKEAFINPECVQPALEYPALNYEDDRGVGITFRVTGGSTVLTHKARQNLSWLQIWPDGITYLKLRKE